MITPRNGKNNKDNDYYIKSCLQCRTSVAVELISQIKRRRWRRVAKLRAFRFYGRRRWQESQSTYSMAPPPFGFGYQALEKVKSLLRTFLKAKLHNHGGWRNIDSNLLFLKKKRYLSKIIFESCK